MDKNISYDLWSQQVINKNKAPTINNANTIRIYSLNPNWGKLLKCSELFLSLSKSIHSVLFTFSYPSATDLFSFLIRLCCSENVHEKDRNVFTWKHIFDSLTKLELLTITSHSKTAKVVAVTFIKRLQERKGCIFHINLQ